FFNDTATTEIYTLTRRSSDLMSSARPGISTRRPASGTVRGPGRAGRGGAAFRSSLSRRTRAAERVDADVVQDRGTDEGGVHVADLALVEIDDDDGVVHELDQGEVRGLVEYGPDDGPDERLQLVDGRRELRHAFGGPEAGVVLKREVGEQGIVGLRDHPLPHELAYDEQVDMGHRRMLHRFDGGGRGAIDDVRGLEPPRVPGRRFKDTAQRSDVELLLLLCLSAEDRYPRHLLRERVDVHDPLAVPLRDMAQDAARARAVRVHIKERLAGPDELDGDILQERRFSD